MPNEQPEDLNAAPPAPSRRLGRRPTRPTPHLLSITRYAPVLPPPPVETDWGRNVASWPMDCNDVLGCCTIAGLAHLVQALGSYAGPRAEVIASDDEVRAAYSQLAGWNPADPATDQGAVMADVLTGWFKNGVTLGGRLDRPLAFMRIDPLNVVHVRQALDAFGPLYVGVNLPLTAQQPGLWDAGSGPDAAPGSWGGHCMLLTGCHASGGIWDFITWGGVQQTTLPWWLAYAEECWAVLHPTWVAKGAAPSGFPVETLTADMAALKLP